MMVFRSKRVSIILALVMIFTAVPAASYAAQDIDTGNSQVSFADMPSDWSTVALSNAVENGLLAGYDGLIMPKDYLTRAQMAAIMNRAFGATGLASFNNYQDVDINAWYYADMQKAVQMKTFVGSDNKLNPDSNITREEVFTVIAKALKLSGASEHVLDIFTDGDLVSTWAKDATASVVEAGYVVGSNSKLNPKQYITRAEFAQVMDNVLKNYIKKSGTYTEDIIGSLMINVPDVILKDIKIEGDLIIGDGVGDGDITLDGVTVTGRTVIRGGGLNSIRIIGPSKMKDIVIARVLGQTRVYAADGIEIGEVIVDGNDDVFIEGNFGTVTLTASEVTVTATSATVSAATVVGDNSKILLSADSDVRKMVIHGENAEIIVAEGSQIETVIAEGCGAEISGSGDISKVYANANDISITTPATTVEAAAGTQGIMAGGSTVEAGSVERVSSSNTRRNSERDSILSTTFPLSSYARLTLIQAGNIADNNVQYESAAEVIVALPKEIAVTLENMEVIDVVLTWTDTDKYSSAEAGEYTFTAAWGEMPVSANNDKKLEAPTTEVTVLGRAIESSPLTSYTQVTLSQTGTIADNNVEYGDSEAVIAALPTEIIVMLENSEAIDIALTWTDTDKYSSAKAGVYTFSAAWGEIPVSANNDNRLQAPTVEVRVLEKVVTETPASYFTFEPTTGMITNYNEDGGLEVVIPRSIDGIAVSIIGANAFQHNQITYIEIPDSVNTIQKEAFAYCNSLTTVIIPDSVTAIQNSTFSYCTSLAIVNIPNGVTVIGENAFSYCAALKALAVPDSVILIGDGAFNNCKSMVTLDLPANGLSINYGAFQYCVGLENITVPGNAIIGYGVFQNCDGLKTVTIGPKADIDYGAFQYCDELVTVTIESEVTIGYGVFQYCDKLRTATIGDDATLGYGIFQYCKAFESITAGSNVTIGNFVCGGSTSFTSLTIDENASIEAWAFDNCTALTSITIGENAFVHSWAFSDSFYIAFTDPVTGGAGAYLYENDVWRNLSTKVITAFGFNKIIPVVIGEINQIEKTVTLIVPNTEELIALCATVATSSDKATITVGDKEQTSGITLNDFTNLLEYTVTAEDGSQVIYTVTVKEASPLSSYEPITLTQTGTAADNDVQYRDATAVIGALPTEIAITLENTEAVDVPVTWEDKDGYNAGKAGDYTFTASWGMLPKSANNDNNLVGPTVEVSVLPGVLKEMPGKYFTFDPSTGTITDYNQAGGLQVLIPSTIDGVAVRIIGASAFQHDQITYVEIPDSVNTIQKEAFAYCNSLATVIIPDSVTTIGVQAFNYSQSLESVDLPDSLTTIQNSTFSYCTSLATVDIPNGVTAIGENAFSYCAALKALAVPDSVILIGDGAFNNCKSMVTLDLPANGLSIDDGAFQYCVGLETITVPGNAIIGYGAFQNCDGLKTVTIGQKADIDYGAFQYCDELVTVTIESEATIGYGVFQYCDKLKNAILEDDVILGYGIFQYCKAFESITAGSNVTIDNYVCGGSTSFNSLTIDENASIEAWAFDNCTALTSITIGENAFVHSWAFSDLFYSAFTNPTTGGAGSYIYDDVIFTWIKQ
jgi:hypothetical protein